MSWFEDWFNSPYYHILYSNRDENEAQQFIQNLFNQLKLPKGSKCLDVACGKGRHVRTMAGLGYDVTGIDLSVKSIQYAEMQHTPNAHFFVHDMREPFALNTFDAVFNLFTSMGYFDTFEENEQAIEAMAANLKTNGVLVIDFFNLAYVKNHLVLSETKEKEGVKFNIQRRIENNFIIKEIEVIDGDSTYHFQEKVAALSQSVFEEWFEKLNLKILETYGDYNLTNYNESTSTRLIYILRK